MNKDNFKFVVIVGLALLVLFFVSNFDPLVEQGLTGSGQTDFTNLALSGTLNVTGASTLTGAVTFAGLIDSNGVADAFVLDADGDTTLAGETDDQIDIEIGGADEVVITASTLTLADMVISQTVGTENLGLPTVLKTSIDIDNDSSPVTCGSIGAGEVWVIHEVYVEVLDNFVCTGDDCTFQVGDGGDANGLLDMVDAELQTGSAEITGGSNNWYGQGAGTLGAFIAAGAGHVYDEASAETIDCAFAGTDLASTTGDTSDDIDVYVIYTRIE